MPESARAAGGEIAFRRPSQQRGIEKFERLLDAARDLIEARGIGNFSLADVAGAAGVATGSAYHFFPGLDAVYVALVERYDAIFAERSGAPLDPVTVSGWQDVMQVTFEDARSFINANPAAITLIIGPGRSWQSRQADTVGDEAIAGAIARRLGALFVLPVQPPTAELLHFGIRILEGIWELSVQRHGYVTEDHAREATRAVVAYMRSYWPERLPRSD
jgi:AcrR family transcriptional regulator